METQQIVLACFERKCRYRIALAHKVEQLFKCLLSGLVTLRLTKRFESKVQIGTVSSPHLVSHIRVRVHQALLHNRIRPLTSNRRGNRLATVSQYKKPATRLRFDSAGSQTLDECLNHTHIFRRSLLEIQNLLVAFRINPHGDNHANLAGEPNPVDQHTQPIGISQRAAP